MQTPMEMEVLFDDAKVEREGKLDLVEMYARIDRYFEESGIPKVAKGHYVGTGNKKDWQNFGAFIMGFEDISWFMDNVKHWTWTTDEGTSNVREGAIQRKKGVFPWTKAAS